MRMTPLTGSEVDPDSGVGADSGAQRTHTT